MREVYEWTCDACKGTHNAVTGDLPRFWFIRPIRVGETKTFQHFCSTQCAANAELPTEVTS